MTYDEAEELLTTASPRKRRLLTCACLRSMWWLVSHEMRAIVVEAEELHPVVLDPGVQVQEVTFANGTTGMVYPEWYDFEAIIKHMLALPPSPQIDDTPDGPEYLGLVAELLTPCVFLPQWRTETVLALAQAMYDTKDFSAMPILADALADAGCPDEEILAHCRGAGHHFRGCWVTDAAMNKS